MIAGQQYLPPGLRPYLLLTPPPLVGNHRWNLPLARFIFTNGYKWISLVTRDSGNDSK